MNRSFVSFAATLEDPLRSALDELSVVAGLPAPVATEIHRRVMGRTDGLDEADSPAQAWSILARRTLWHDLVDGLLEAKLAAKLDRLVEQRLAREDPRAS